MLGQACTLGSDTKQPLCMTWQGYLIPLTLVSLYVKSINSISVKAGFKEKYADTYQMSKTSGTDRQ